MARSLISASLDPYYDLYFPMNIKPSAIFFKACDPGGLHISISSVHKINFKALGLANKGGSDLKMRMCSQATYPVNEGLNKTLKNKKVSIGYVIQQSILALLRLSWQE